MSKPPFCSRVFSACSSSPCLHDGTCILDTSHSYHCGCLAGYTGQRCENGEYTKLWVNLFTEVMWLVLLVSSSCIVQLKQRPQTTSMQSIYVGLLPWPYPQSPISANNSEWVTITRALWCGELPDQLPSLLVISLSGPGQSAACKNCHVSTDGP